MSAAGVLQLDTPFALIHPANGQFAYGQMTTKSPTEIVVSAYRGTRVVDRDDNARTADKGTSYDVTLELNFPPPSREKADVTPVVNRHLIFRAIGFVGAGVATHLP